MENQRKEIIDDYDFFVNACIGQDRWEKLPAIKKLQVLKIYSKIQELVKKEYIS